MTAQRLSDLREFNTDGTILDLLDHIAALEGDREERIDKWMELVDELQTQVALLEARIDWALRCNRSGMVGFVPSLLRNLDDLDYPINSAYTLRDYIEATEREDKT